MERPTNFKLGIRMEYDNPRHLYAMTSNLKALGGCSSHHLQEAGTYFGSPTTGLLISLFRVYHRPQQTEWEINKMRGALYTTSCVLNNACM